MKSLSMILAIMGKMSEEKICIIPKFARNATELSTHLCRLGTDYLICDFIHIGI